MFIPNKELLDMFIIQNAVLANSVTVAVGDAVVITGGAPFSVTPNGANTTAAIFGTVRAINSSSSQGNTYLQKSSITTAADNQTNAKISVDILLSSALTTYVVDLDAAAGTTANSQYFGYFSMKSGSAGLLLESSYSATVVKQFLSFGLLPGSTTQVTGIFSTLGRI